ncbi:MAG: hypothetical protein H0T89_23885 [Deltaproteobacteria bacterium]|nr:hypothetical protein [Deltaproteobacteria bacterium]MDQ3300649.1 LamG domain-containing protein [Myxococcota bacterium]
MYRVVMAASVMFGCGRTGFDLVPDAAGDAERLGRVAAGLVALYTFEEGTGTRAGDVSQIDPPLDLQLGGDTAWIPGGLEFGAAATATISVAPATKITSRCMASGESTIEVWVESMQPSIVGAGRIVGVASDNNVAVLSLGQEATAYYGQVRTTSASTKLVSPRAVSRSLTHLAHARSADGVRRLYLDGAEITQVTTVGTFDSWDPTLPVTLGNAPDGGVLWEGRLFLAAFYCRALTGAEIEQNFVVGP